MAKNDQIVRILTLARDLAGSRRGIHLKTVAERHEWPLRNVYRDLDALQRAGFPVVEQDGRYRLPEGWSAPALPGIEGDEILALFTVRAFAGACHVTSLGRALDRLWMKLTADRTGQAALLPDREPWLSVRTVSGIDYRAHAQTIATFETAIRERVTVNCRYRAISTRTVTARLVEPSELYWDPGLESLYLIGWCRLRHEVRVFAAHRFLMAALTEQHFVPKPEARSKNALKNAFRVWRSKTVETVRIRFSPAVAEEIRERRWGPEQFIEEHAGGAVVLTLQVAGLAEIERWILSFGANAQVLAPVNLIQRIRRSWTRSLDASRDASQEPLLRDDNGLA